MAQIKESLSVLLIPADDTLGLILWCIFIGVCISFLSLYRQKMGLGKALTALMEKKAFSPDSAVALPKNILPFSVRKGKDSMILSVEKEGKALFYLPEEKTEKACALLKNQKTPLWLAILELVGFYIVLFLISQVLPLILEGFSNLEI